MRNEKIKKTYLPLFLNIREHFNCGMFRKIPQYYMPESELINSFDILDIGASKIKKIIGAKIIPDKDNGIEFDANKDSLPYVDKSIIIIHCHHIFEHLQNIDNLMKEIDRVLHPKGCVYITVPHYSQELAHEDPYHVRTFAIDTFDNFFANPHYSEAEYEYDLEVRVKFMMAIADRNLSIFYQLKRKNNEI